MRQFSPNLLFYFLYTYIAILYKFCSVLLATPVIYSTQFILEIAFDPHISLFTEFLNHVTNIFNRLTGRGGP
jgi:hypothetical protein